MRGGRLVAARLRVAQGGQEKAPAGGGEDFIGLAGSNTGGWNAPAPQQRVKIAPELGGQTRVECYHGIYSPESYGGDD